MAKKTLQIIISSNSLKSLRILEATMACVRMKS